MKSNITEIRATIKDLKGTGVVIPPHLHSAPLFALYRRQVDVGE